MNAVSVNDLCQRAIRAYSYFPSFSFPYLQPLSSPPNHWYFLAIIYKLSSRTVLLSIYFFSCPQPASPTTGRSPSYMPLLYSTPYYNMPRPGSKRPSTRTNQRAKPYPVPSSSQAMPGPITSTATGHRHTESVTSKRHSSGVWTNHDDEQLKHARQREGLNWTAIAVTHFPTKTPNACRKRHERLMEKINANGNWDTRKFEEVAKAYLEVREEMWKMVADRVNEKWTVVESKVRNRQPLMKDRT